MISFEAGSSFDLNATSSLNRIQLFYSSSTRFSHYDHLLILLAPTESRSNNQIWFAREVGEGLEDERKKESTRQGRGEDLVQLCSFVR